MHRQATRDGAQWHRAGQAKLLHEKKQDIKKRTAELADRREKLAVETAAADAKDKEQPSVSVCLS